MPESQGSGDRWIPMDNTQYVAIFNGILDEGKDSFEKIKLMAAYMKSEFEFVFSGLKKEIEISPEKHNELLAISAALGNLGDVFSPKKAQ
jgi:hypothetical protein